MLKIISVAQSRALDQEAIFHYGIRGFDLMDKAGQGLAMSVISKAGDKTKYPAILMIAGKGNNGGDVFAASRYLRKSSIPHNIIVFSSKQNIKGDALSHLRLLKKNKKFPIFFSEDLPFISEYALSKKTSIIVDGLLGTGVKGKVRPAYRSLLELLNRSKKYIISVDVPSGMNGDNGRGFSIVADETITMGLPKTGLFINTQGQKKCGKITVVDIGYPQNLLKKADSDCFLIEKTDACSFFKKKPVTSHKGTFGSSLLVAGSDRYPGALLLSAGAALKANSGIITVLSSRDLRNIIATSYPEVIYELINHNSLNPLVLRKIKREFSSILIGPGLGSRKGFNNFIRSLINQYKNTPIVIDADGLNNLSGKMHIISDSKNRKLVLTPHPKEFSRLTDLPLKEVLSNRFKAVVSFSKRNRVYTVLKGHSTVICDPNGKTYINPTGNPVLATAGTGDILAGIITAFAGYKDIELINAIIAAVYVHGLSGDICLSKIGSYGVSASDVLTAIPEAINCCINR
jgi:ADP-dependent NAD(P)H-hydrate dehydratase / NAD(P)H-hydrate epimerase